MSKVYSYLRFSDPKQAAGGSADRQIAYAKRWAAEHGLMLDTSLTLRDEGLSAYHERHVKSGALGLFLAAVEAGKVPKGSTLIVEGLDRLSRAEPMQAQAQLTQIISAGLTVVTASDGKSYSRASLKANPMDMIYSLLVMIRAHEESDTKAKRVKEAIRRQCMRWQDGAYRGIIRNGSDPAWLKLDEQGKWQIIPEREAAVRKALALYLKGYGAERIVHALDEAGLCLTEIGPHALQIYRLIKQRALLGEKELTVGGESFCLKGYYPALLTEEEWDELQGVQSGRKMTRDRGPLAPVLTGTGVLKCAYCGQSMQVQNLLSRKRLPDGRVADCNRRLRCVNNDAHTRGHKQGCPAGAGGPSAAPFERALMAYCSDLMNLRALYEGDRTSGPKAKLAEARAVVADHDKRIGNLLDLMEQGGSKALAVRLTKLEADKAKAQAAIEQAERELAAASRVDLKGADAQWRKLAKGVEAQDFDARTKARKLIGETFERIALYWRADEEGRFGMVLRARGGVTRMLRIDRAGNWQEAEDVDALPELLAA